MQRIPQIRHDLITKSGHDFQGAVARLVAELLEGSVESKRLGCLDRDGVDVYVYPFDDLTHDQKFQFVIQCKGFEVGEYGADQHQQCRDEIAKFLKKGPNTREYWLVINRPIKHRQLRDELQSDLDRLVEAQKAEVVFLLDLDLFLNKTRQIAADRLAFWAEEKRKELLEYYDSRLGFVDYIRDVPFSSEIEQLNPVAHVLGRAQEFFRNLGNHQTGPHRHPPRFLLTSGFGFGKTSALHALAGDWTRIDGHLIYVPAAMLGPNAFTNSSGLADEFLDFLIPDDVELTDPVRRVFRDALRHTLATAKNWLVLIDGIDESPESLKANAMSNLRNCIKDLGVPTVLSARDELVDIRPSEFASTSQREHGRLFDRVSLLDWPNGLILRFLEKYAEVQNEAPSSDFSEFKELVRAGRYAEVYGDIPKRPLFLGMLAQDAWLGNKPTRELHRLYGKYFREKFLLDRQSAAAKGVSRRPSRIVDAFGADEAQERLMHVMQDVASTMVSATRTSKASGEISLVQIDTIPEHELSLVATRNGIEFVQMEDIVMHSLLQPAGRSATRARLLRFAHRSFQDWFLARHLAVTPRVDKARLPTATQRFLSAMQADLQRGIGLP